jgi:hypothetical protein
MTVPPNLPANSGTPYSFAINGTNGGTTHRVIVAFNNVGSAGSVQPNSATLAVGASATFSVNINSQAFSGNVNFACNGQPAWIQCAFNPSSITAPGSTSSVLTVKVVSASTGALLRHPPSAGHLPAQRSPLLWSLAGTALCLLAMALVFIGRRERLSGTILLRGFAVMALTVVLATGLVSCGGAAAPTGANGAGGSGGTAKFMVQAQAGNGTTNLGLVAITTP